MTARKQPRRRPEHDPDRNARIRRGGDPETGRTPVWGLRRMDMDGAWGWRRVESERWWNRILPVLQNFESMTWAELMSGSGGRSAGTNNHPVPVGGLSRKARKRLGELRQDDLDELFSLRIAGKERVYGIRDGRTFHLLRYDPNHDVYPVKGR